MVVFTIDHVKFSTAVITKRDYCVHILHDDNKGPNYFQLTYSPDYPGLWTIFYRTKNKFDIYKHYERITAQECVEFFNNTLDIDRIIVP
jgi:hypothetical protein